MSMWERIVLRRICGWLMTVGIAGGLVACAPSGGGGSPTNQGPRTVQVQMSDELRFEPAEFTFQAGETVRFEVTNAGAIVHEFLIGDEAAQEDFEKEMSEGGGMAHDGEAGVSVEPGQSETFEYTFAEAGDPLLAVTNPATTMAA
jgi:uncharacterized cupredoxin-like copper-binding protein